MLFDVRGESTALGLPVQNRPLWRNSAVRSAVSLSFTGLFALLRDGGYTSWFTPHPNVPKMTQPSLSKDSETFRSGRAAGGGSSRSRSESELVSTPFVPASFRSPEDVLKRASIHASRDKCSEALRIYEEGLKIYPNEADLWSGKGVCLRSLGRLDEALQCYEEALRLDPKNANAVNNIGVIHKERGDLNKAIECYKKALVLEPRHATCRSNLAIALTDLATKLKQEKDLDSALKSYKEALKVDPTYSPCYYNLGVLYAEKNDAENALRMYREAIRINPSYVEAHNNTGAVYKSLGKLEKAIEHYELALVHNPEYKITQINMAVALTDLGTKRKETDGPKEGVRLYKKALTYNAYYADAYYNLGVAYAELAKYERALTHYKLAVNFNPRCAEAYNNMGVIQKDRECIDDAIKSYNKALEIKPHFAQALNNLGVIYTFIGKMTEALKYTRKALEVSPNYAEAYNNLGVLYRDRGEIELSIEAYDKCLALDPNSPNAFHNKLLALNYQPSLPTDKVYRLSKTWGEQFLRQRSPYKKWECELVRVRPIRGEAPETQPGTGTRRTRCSRQIRLGYIGPDFFTHSVSYFVHTPLLYHDRDQFHVTVYANVVRDDAKTQLLMKLADRWRPIVGMAETEVARIIHDEDKIDILVELAGHTANNRLDVMAYKPAPIQMNWIGYPNTTGLSTIDYRITDPVADPPHTKQKYVEKLLRLPQCFLCYQPPPGLPVDFEVKPPPVVDNGFITFGSFNNLAKLSDQVLDMWSRILLAVPDSRLFLKARPFASKEMQRWFVEKFETRGVASHRIDTMSLVPSCADHLMVYNVVDIALDTFPYAGTTTTCEALLMGVPVISMRGHNNHAHNVGVSLLLYYGLPELVAEDPDDYFRRAVELSSDVKRLVEYRGRIHQSVLRMSHKENAELFTRDLEELYKGALGKLHSGAPASGTK